MSARYDELVAEEENRPLSDDEIRALGYEPTPDGWKPRSPVLERTPEPEAEKVKAPVKSRNPVRDRTPEPRTPARRTPRPRRQPNARRSAR